MDAQATFDMQDLVDLQGINTQDLIAFCGEPVSHTLSDLDNILGKLDEEPAPVAKIEDIPLPLHWNAFPNLEPAQTSLDFDIHIDQGDKLNWLYSVKQEKVYIKLNSMMHLTVSYVPLSAEPLFVRAMIVFSRRDEMHLPVTRCPNHRMLRSDVPAFHILKCCNPGTEYHGTENESWFGQRSSLLVPMGPLAASSSTGRCQESLGLEFLCQNSCSNGIQRKQTVLVFTLENDRKQIFGKRVMHFKVCSCPKRDMSKEMNTATPPRKRPAGGPPSAGKQPSTKQLCVSAAAANNNSSTLCVKSEPPAPTLPTPLLTPSTGDSSPVSQFGGNASERSESVGGGGGGGDAVVAALSTSIDSFKFETTAGTPETLPMSSPPAQQQPQQQQQRPNNESDAGLVGGFGLNLVMPTRESAQHVLRCAYNELAGCMARDGTNSAQYVSYAQQMEQYATDNNMQL